MTQQERAKQFAPYAALKGFGAYIRSAERETVERVILGEDAAQELDRCLRELHIGDIIKVRYYLRQQYVDLSGNVKKIDLDRKVIQVDNIHVPIRDILHIEIK